MRDVSDPTPSTTEAPLKRPPLKRLWELALTEWRFLAFGTGFLLLGAGMTIVFPTIVGEVVDTALSTESIDAAAFLLFGIFAVQSIALGVRYFLFAVAGERVVARLRERVYGSILGQDIAFFDERRTGELTNRLAADTTTLQNAVTNSLPNFVRDVVVTLGVVAMLFLTSPKLTFVMLALVLPTVALAVIFGRRIERLAREVQDALADAGHVAQETISGIRTVRAFARERLAVQTYGRAVWHAFRTARRHRGYYAALIIVSSLAASIAVSVVVWYGGRLVQSGTMTAGEFSSFIIYTLTLAATIGLLSDTWAQIVSARGAATHVFELHDRVPMIPISGGRELARLEGQVELQGVHFRYPTRSDVPVLRGIDLTLERGAIVALVGPSGSGKSTVAGLIPRFYDPIEGTVTIDGHDVRSLDPTWLRGHIGIVAQEPLLFSSTVADNIRYGRFDATDEEVEAAARAAHAHDFISGFPEGYQTQVGERGLSLSAGQKQRIAIARAVLKDPRILILDEATSALDSESEHLVKEALDDLMEGRTTLVIAHRLSTVRHAHTVVVIEGGEIIQSGSHAELMGDDQGLYHRLVQKQFLAT